MDLRLAENGPSVLRERVTGDWKTDKGEELNEKFYASLRDRYTIVVESFPPADKLALSGAKVE